MFQPVEMRDAFFKERILDIAGSVPENLAIVVKESKGGVLFLQGDSCLNESNGSKIINTLCIEAYQGNNTNRVFVVWRKPGNKEPAVIEYEGKDLFVHVSQL
ncbi:MAG: hypothetical protein UR66_C0002G0129 [Candidatus Moranbacteria bacterium GW2011_GWE1_35_17]|nr:MAG: hypothetical protein UR66_C0002G0129 [Candidatus Moranbacteria bacterium GW2011_GWE1_35_17]KKP84492.1 MAG: hypothetical protein UR82_C0004G0008 [Candidatus Moranbacteria bacterium GW2011_GWF1_35_5]